MKNALSLPYCKQVRCSLGTLNKGLVDKCPALATPASGAVTGALRANFKSLAHATYCGDCCTAVYMTVRMIEIVEKRASAVSCCEWRAHWLQSSPRALALTESALQSMASSHLYARHAN